MLLICPSGPGTGFWYVYASHSELNRNESHRFRGAKSTHFPYCYSTDCDRTADCLLAPLQSCAFLTARDRCSNRDIQSFCCSTRHSNRNRADSTGACAFYDGHREWLIIRDDTARLATRHSSARASDGAVNVICCECRRGKSIERIMNFVIIVPTY